MCHLTYRIKCKMNNFQLQKSPSEKIMHISVDPRFDAMNCLIKKYIKKKNKTVKNK